MEGVKQQKYRGHVSEIYRVTVESCILGELRREEEEEGEREREDLDLSTCGDPDQSGTHRLRQVPQNLTIKIESAVVLPNEPFHLPWNENPLNPAWESYTP